VHAVLLVIVEVNAGTLHPAFEEFLVRTVLPRAAARRIVVVTDLEAALTDGVFTPGAIEFLVSLVDRHDMVVAIDHHERVLMTVDQGLQIEGCRLRGRVGLGVHRYPLIVMDPALLSVTSMS
jgi:hypothetical protein